MGGREDVGIEAWEAMLRTHAGLVKILEEEVREAAGVPLSWYDVLLELSRAPGRQLRMSDLGERVVLSRSRVSRLVDEMAESGFVEKKPDPEDGRATLARMTDEGRSAFRRAAPVYLDGIRRNFSDHLSPSEQRTILGAFGRILAQRE